MNTNRSPQAQVASQTPSNGAKAPHAAEAETLLGRARRGDRKALEALLAEARPRALAVALRVLHHPDDAEDAVQDAFVKVCRHVTRFEGRAAFSTWLHRIVVNTSLDLLRRHEARAERLTDDDGEDEARIPVGVQEETPEDDLGRGERAVAVRAALQVLSPVHREALVLREFDDRSYGEIARHTRCPVGTVMSRLFHARRKIAEVLRQEHGEEAMLAA